MTFGRAFALIGLGLLLLITQSSIQALLPWHLPVPQVMLLMVLYVGLSARGTAPQQLWVALALGYLADLFGGSPTWLHALSFSILLLLARSWSSRLFVDSTWQVMAIAFGSALLHAALTVGLSAPMYGGEAPSALRAAPLAALATALLAPIIFKILRKMDRKLAPDPRALKLR